MRGFRILFCFALMVGFALEVLGQRVELSDDEIQAAVEKGIKHKKDHFGLRLEDQTVNFMNFLGNVGKSYWEMEEEKGFSIEAFTPTTWISECAAQATRQNYSFGVENVTDEMKAPVFYLVVHGKHSTTWDIFDANGNAARGEPVTHVVLRSENKQLVIEPAKEAPFQAGDQDVFGSRFEFDGLRVEFSLDDVARVRAASNDGEFFVSVVGEKSEKDFKIKKKHFDKLP